jgi:hypothetical protein
MDILFCFVVRAYSLREFQQGQEIFLFTKVSVLALGLTHPTFQWVQAVLSQAIKQFRHKANH